MTDSVVLTEMTLRHDIQMAAQTANMMTKTMERANEPIIEQVREWANEHDDGPLCRATVVSVAKAVRDWSGHPPRTVAAAVVYHATNQHPTLGQDDPPTQAEVAEDFEATPKTVRNVWHSIGEGTAHQFEWMEAEYPRPDGASYEVQAASDALEAARSETEPLDPVLFADDTDEEASDE